MEGVTERILSEMDDFIQTGKLPWLENEKRPVRSIASCKKLSLNESSPCPFSELLRV